jgi:hypothetical protein
MHERVMDISDEEVLQHRVIAEVVSTSMPPLCPRSAFDFIPAVASS